MRHSCRPDFATEPAKLKRLEPTILQAKVFTALGLAHQDQDDYVLALKCHKKALTLARKVNALSIEANALNNLGMVHNELRDPKAALPLFRKALAMHRALGNRNNEANVLVNTGLAYAYLGKHRRTISSSRLAFKIMSDIGNVRNQARALGNIANAYRTLGSPERALRFFRRAVVLSRLAGDVPEMLTNLLKQGWIHETSGQNKQAIKVYKAYTKAALESGRRIQYGIGLRNLGDAYFLAKKVKYCLKAYQESLSFGKKTKGYQSAEATVLYRIGLMYTRLGQIRRAISYLKRAEGAARRSSDQETKRKALRRRAEIYAGIGLSRRSAACQARERDVVTEIVANTKSGTVLTALGKIYRDQGNYSMALSIYEEAAILTPDDASIEFGIGLVLFCMKELSAAQAHLQMAVDLNPDSPVYQCTLANAFLEQGLNGRAAELLGRVARMPRPESDYDHACIEAVHGHSDNALSFLAAALWNEEVALSWIVKDPDLKSVQQDERLAGLLASERGCISPWSVARLCHSL